MVVAPFRHALSISVFRDDRVTQDQTARLMLWWMHSSRAHNFRAKSLADRPRRFAVAVKSMATPIRIVSLRSFRFPPVQAVPDAALSCRQTDLPMKVVAARDHRAHQQCAKADPSKPARGRANPRKISSCLRQSITCPFLQSITSPLHRLAC